MPQIAATARVNIHYRIIAAISVEVKSVEGFRFYAFNVVGVDESAERRVVVAALQTVEARIAIEVVAAVMERHFVCKRAALAYDIAVEIVFEGCHSGAAFRICAQYVAEKIFFEVYFTPSKIIPAIPLWAYMYCVYIAPVFSPTSRSPSR